MHKVNLRMWSAVIAMALAAEAAAAEPKPDAPPAAEPKPVSVAVLNYEVASRDNPRLGSQMADILTARLSIEDAFELVERATLQKVLTEQKLTLVGLTDPQQAAKVGRLIGAKVLVIGKAFLMDKKLMIVTKLVGVETGRVVGTIRQVEASKPISEAVMLLGEDVAALIRKKAAALLPKATRLPDPAAQIRKAVEKAFGKDPPSVAVIIPELHVRRVVIDPAVETEIKKVLIECGFKVLDTGSNALADWAKGMMKGKRPPWPAALNDADAIVVGEAFSEFAARTGELVTCTGRAEINLIDRKTGRILLADRQTRRAVDLSELIAGKTALQAAGRRLSIAVCRALLKHKPPPVKGKGPGRKPARAPKSKAAAAGPGGGASPWTILAAVALTATDSPRAAPAPKPPAPAAADGKTAKGARRTVFAAPFENETRQEQYDPAAEGMGDLVAVLLAEQEHIRVVERQRLTALTAEQARALKGLTGRKYAIQAGRLLKADTVLTGRLYLVQKKLMVSVQAIDIASDRVAASGQLACRPEYVLEAALQLARRLGRQMALPLPEIDLKKIDKAPIASLHFAKAISRYYAGNMDAAIMQFMRTMDLDPDYVEAHYWAGMAHHRLGEDAHAVIEWEKFLKRCPESRHDKQLRQLLADAKQREKESTVERLGPPSTQPARKAG